MDDCEHKVQTGYSTGRHATLLISVSCGVMGSKQCCEIIVPSTIRTASNQCDVEMRVIFAVRCTCFLLYYVQASNANTLRAVLD